MKKTFTLILTVCVFFAFSLCGAGMAEAADEGRQVATAWLDQDGAEIAVMVDLSGGWSVEFAHGAFYLYDAGYSEDKEAVAIGITLDQEVFLEYSAEAAAAESYREIEGSESYTQEDGTQAYLTRVGDDAYFMLWVHPDADGDAVFARVKLEREAEEVAVDPSQDPISAANPWVEVETADEAAEGAGVGYFMVPEEGLETTGGSVRWSGFQYMLGLAEADGSIGTADLTVRKGLKQDSQDVSGDYTEYAYAWTEEIDGWEVSCFGNEEGKAMKAIWLSDNFSYSIMIRGQGDSCDTYGVDGEAVSALVAGIQ